MKEIISEQEIKKFNYYGSIYTVHLAVLIISAVPLFMWLGRYASLILSTMPLPVIQRHARCVIVTEDFNIQIEASTINWKLPE